MLDATFATASEREAASKIAAETVVAFDGLFLDAPLDTRLARIAGRGPDASDADARVARRQRADPLREREWEVIDASGGLAETIALARERLVV